MLQVECGLENLAFLSVLYAIAMLDNDNMVMYFICIINLYNGKTFTSIQSW